MTGSFSGRRNHLPKPYDPDALAHGMEDLRAAIDALTDPARQAAASAAMADPDFEALLQAVLGNSPYLSRALVRDPDFLADLHTQPPHTLFDALVAETTTATAKAQDQAALMTLLRRAKERSAILIALADIADLWALDEVTQALTRFADMSVNATIDWLLGDAQRTGQIVAPPTGGQTGLVVIAMGKHGARELNYSSDIDLVVFYEPGILALKDGLEPGRFFVKLTQNMVKILQERTADGYVFRTDLRLRPDPGGTQVAVSLPAAEVYYESRGQNWERAAFIKARPIAGDEQAGTSFLNTLSAFIWRKNLDFAAIEDIHSMKRQIHAFGGHGTIAIAGHNVKLGRGGIREIEFFVQTQQLIAGGRDRSLRGRQTGLMLDQLAEAGWITAKAAEELKNSYTYLRRLEHRLQMIADEQTHTLPDTQEGLARIACFMGCESVEAFSHILTGHLTCVQGHYAALFETAPPLTEESGSLVFTGGEDDPETLQTLEGMGFKNPSDLSSAIRAWHSGRYAATRSPRSRERLTALIPSLLRALSKTSNPDTAFVRFDQFLTRLPAGVQLFSMLYANPDLLDLLADICGTAPRLASYLSANPAVLEAVLNPDFFLRLPGPEQLRTSLATALEPAKDYQDTLDFARVWARERRFRLGVRVLSSRGDAAEVGPAYAALAGELIAGLIPAALAEVMRRHGEMIDGRFAVIGMGKLGSMEMSASSDLDLVTIYDVPVSDALSVGPKPLSASQYYARVSQQLVNALTAPTTEGKLYEVDMRLRPSGNAGPIATRLSSFKTYQQTDAWTWEHMALTRAHVIAGDATIKSDIEETVRAVLCQPRHAGKTATDVADMRKRIAKEHPTDNPWELKHVRGGLIDIEFICQYLQLVHAHEHPDVLKVQTRASLEALAQAGLIPSGHAQNLLAALDLILNLTQISRICVEGVLAPDEATGGLKTLLCRAGNAPDLMSLNAQLADSQEAVRAAFQEIVATPAGAG